MSESWSEIAAGNLAAAGELMRLGHHRSSVSRSYYAAFAGLAQRLAESGVTFADDREAPPHGDRLRELVMNNIPGLLAAARRDVRRLVKVLYGLRISADYHRSVSVGLREAREALLHAQLIMRRLNLPL